MDVRTELDRRGSPPAEPTAEHADTLLKPTEAGLRIASPKRALLLLARALRLRCPNCGRGRVMASWFRLRPRCQSCGLQLERGEHDYFLGAILFNLIIAELLYALLLVVLLLWMWPVVPWGLLETGGIALMVLFPILLFPFSKAIWLALDLMVRPPTAEEFKPGAVADA